MPTSTTSSESSQPPSPSSRLDPNRSSSYFTYPITYAVSGVLRRLNTESSPNPGATGDARAMDKIPSSSALRAQLQSTASSLSHSFGNLVSNASENVFQPPHRMASPFQPPPLTPLTLKGYGHSTKDSGKLMSRSLAEEIRLLLPPRIQLVDEWRIAYSLDEHGSSLSTLYEKSEHYSGRRGGFVLVVKDGDGGTFGAYLSDHPHPNDRFFGTGECFLWRAHILNSLPDLANLPPPPSADTTHATRMTTIATSKPKPRGVLSPPASGHASRSGTSTPERMRFQAFLYTGLNDFEIYCQRDYLSIGSG
jgi:hypothetical protein